MNPARRHASGNPQAPPGAAGAPTAPRSASFSSRSLGRLFVDALDELEVSYDTYWEIDQFRPRCLPVLDWVLRRGKLGGKAFVLGTFPLAFSMFLAKIGFQVESLAVAHRIEPWRELEGLVRFSDLVPNLPRGVRYDLIICDDLLQHLPRPLEILQAMEERLRPEGILLIVSPNAARGSTRLRLLLGRNVYPWPEEEICPGEDGEEEGPRVLPYREYLPAELKGMLPEAGLRFLDSGFLPGKKAVRGGLCSLPLRSYLARKAYHSLQMILPPLRSHFFVAATRGGGKICASS